VPCLSHQVWGSKAIQGVLEMQTRRETTTMKQFKNFPQYAMDVNGDVYRLNKNGLRKIEGQKDTKGYIQICLYLDGKRYFKMHHRLIAEEFIPNPLNKSQINHINGIKTDNRICNLEWVTPKENVRHAIDNNLWHRSKLIRG
jgi:hypothetical protein